MKFITALVLTALLSFAIGLFTFLPWYSFVVCALVVAATVHQKPFKAFLSGFIAILVLWFVLATIKDVTNEHILSKRVAEILPLHGNYILLTVITSLIGGLLGGMGALTGSYFRKVKPSSKESA